MVQPIGRHFHTPSEVTTPARPCTFACVVVCSRSCCAVDHRSSRKTEALSLFVTVEWDPLSTRRDADYVLATSRRWLDMSKQTRPMEMIMKKVITSALVALSVLSGTATLANAASGEEFGARTAAGQVASPN